MCGITGFILKKKTNNLDYFKKLTEMNKTVSHRGPDNIGTWFCENQRVFIGHQRLSIFDLSSKGNQPMLSNDGRYVISFNGEIYNFRTLRQYLEKKFKKKFSNNTDTQVLLELISVLGIEKTLKKIEGMFAFAYWDKKLEVMTLVRDRYGEKPLHYYIDDEKIIFSSEIKAIINFFQPKKLEINFEATKLYRFFGYIPAPLSIYKNLFKVMPSQFIKFTKTRLIKKNYWNNFYPCTDFKKYEDSYYIKSTERLIEKSVKKMMEADVEVGCFLSGGIDSSLVTSIMQKNSINKVKTFSVGFNETQYDESKYAKKISDWLGTEHHEIFLSIDDLLNNIFNINKIFDEPFADSSCLPTELVSKFASKSLKVVLSGDGADELFLGYNRYLFSKRIEKLNSFLPKKIRKKIQGFLNVIPSNILDNLSRPIQKTFGLQGFSHKIEKLANIMDYRDGNDFYKKSIIMDNEKLNDFLNYKNAGLINSYNDLELIESVQKNDLNLYLTNDILTKVDRTSMANSLEVRAPFLDHKLSEFLNMIPTSLKIKEGNTKYILKQILQKYLPKKLFQRPKMGFAIPIDRWLKKKKMVDICDEVFHTTSWEELNYKNIEMISLWENYKKYSNFPPSKIWLYLIAGLWLKK